MLFRLKNIGATYQRVVTALFHDMMHKEVEVYVDDMMVKSETREGHFEALDKVLSKVRKVQLETQFEEVCLWGIFRKIVRAYSQ